MSDFWAKKLQPVPPQPVPPQPVPPQPVPPQPVQQRNVAWWATPAAPQQVTPQPVQPQPQQGYGSTTPEGQSVSDMLRQGNYTTDKAQSNKDHENCPECGSGNYMRPPGSKNGHPPAKRCTNCGYNEMFQQSMAGMSGTGQNIPVKTARVQQGNVSNVNMTPFAHI